jgi:hypothetical protein
LTAATHETATAPSGPTGKLATWVAGLTLADVPAPVRERAKHLLLDGIGCALIGAQLPWSRTATEAVLDIDGAGDTVVIGSGRTASGPAAAVLNGTFIQGFELDDFHPIAPLHSCSLVLPALLSTAASLPRTRGVDFLLAAIVGFEVGPRVGYTLNGVQMLDRGWHSGSVFGTHSAAMASGKLRGLSPARLEDALGLAATQSSGLMAAQFEAMSKRMHHGAGGAQRAVCRGSRRTRLHRNQEGVRARIRRIPQRFRRRPPPPARLADERPREAVGDADDHGEVLRRDGRTAGRQRCRAPTASFGASGNALLRAIAGHVVARGTLVGTYEP